MNETVDIVSLIEKNPVTSLTRHFNNRFIEKIKQNFTETQQYMFVGSFYCFLNHHPTNDFVVELESVWKWLGFARIDPCKVVLKKHFVENIDYKIEKKHEVNVHAPATSGASFGTHGGSNKEKVTMNIDTFKKLCMKSNTKKADEVHNYFVKLERTLLEIVNEETSELRMQLANNDEKTLVKIRSKEDAIIDQFPDGEMCIYIGDIGIHEGEHIVKFGESNNLKQRVASHRRLFKNFELVTAYKVINSKKFEHMLKEVPEVRYRRRKIDTNTELIMVDSNFTIENLDKIVKYMIEKHCTLEAVIAEYDLEKSKIELKKSEEETKQIQEKTRQMELEIRIFELKNKSFSPSIPKQTRPQQLDIIRERASQIDKQLEIEKIKQDGLNTREKMRIDRLAVTTTPEIMRIKMERERIKKEEKEKKKEEKTKEKEKKKVENAQKKIRTSEGKKAERLNEKLKDMSDTVRSIKRYADLPDELIDEMITMDVDGLRDMICAVYISSMVVFKWEDHYFFEGKPSSYKSTFKKYIQSEISTVLRYAKARAKIENRGEPFNGMVDNLIEKVKKWDKIMQDMVTSIMPLVVIRAS